MGLVRKTAIVVPCYNEEKRLNARAFVDFASAHPAISFIFVDDGSTDSTAGKLKSMGSVDPARMRLLSLGKNSGKAEAVRRGILKALEGDYASVGYWDADLATPLEAIPGFSEILYSSEATVVMGSRVRLLGRKIERNPMRHYLGRVFATLASLMLKIPVYDTQCGAKVFKKTDALKAAVSEPFSVKWTFDVELLARIKLVEKAEGRPGPEELWVEYPLTRWADVKGSNIRSRDFIRGGLEFLKVFALLYIPPFKDRYLRRFTGRG